MLTYILNQKRWLVYCFGFAIIAAAVMIVEFYQLGMAADVKQAKQKSFPSPEEAVKSLVGAVKSNDTKELLAIFGPAGKEIISSGDQVADKGERARFVNAYETMNKLEKETDEKVTLIVGNDDWPFPVPIVKKDEAWVFDTMAGKEELLDRRIGRNELNTIQTCLAYVDAEMEYAMKDRDSDKVREYAQKSMSTPGKKDGLYWKTKEGEEPSPLGDLFAKAVKAGYTPGKGGGPQPYWGYYYKILKAQGENAPGGAYDYVIKGKMIGGFALVAYPAEYGASGIMTFIVNHDGVVYQKDLGKETGKIASAMTKFDPDETWKKVE
ncbi:MAG TPA: DUF2950 domain-containing protein [Thermodesulfobacteriota bacterium]|nr:DUF2950 domain-containing protein [Thermodesulfobacteriota bacterium]